MEIQPAWGILRPGRESTHKAGNKHTPRGTNTWGRDSKLFHGEQPYALTMKTMLHSHQHVHLGHSVQQSGTRASVVTITLSPPNSSKLLPFEGPRHKLIQSPTRPAKLEMRYSEVKERTTGSPANAQLLWQEGLYAEAHFAKALSERKNCQSYLAC